MLKFRKRSRRKPERLDLILTEDTPFAVVEAYKAARTNFMFLLSDYKRKEVVFTSAVAEEGKTITCINMAITFAQTGFKVLVIDADMRKPRVHRLLKVPSSPGLSDRLGNLTEQDCIYTTYHPNVYVMPAGTIPPNPAELLASTSMKNLLDELNESFDHIFIDTPPVAVVTDATVLASRLHGLILVARQDYSRKEIVQSTIDALKQVGVNILGMLLTDVKVDRYGGRYHYNYYYNYYNYYGGYGEKPEPDQGEEDIE